MLRTRLFASFTLFLATVATAFAGPPDVPARLSAPSGKVKEFVVKVEKGKTLEYKLVGGAAAFRGFPGDNPDETVFWLVPEDESTLYIVWWQTGVKGSSTTVVNERLIPDPKKPPPVSGKYFFYIVRPDGPAAPEFTRTMSLPEWKTLRDAGHTISAYTKSEAARFGIAVDSALPAVVTLIEDDSKSYIARQPIPLPTTGAGILKLPEGVR